MEEVDQYLSGIYYDPKRPGSFGGLDNLHRDVKEEGKYKVTRKQVQEWLIKQDAYTRHKPVR